MLTTDIHARAPQSSARPQADTASPRRRAAAANEVVLHVRPQPHALTNTPRPTPAHMRLSCACGRSHARAQAAPERPQGIKGIGIPYPMRLSIPITAGRAARS